jgi:nucleoside-diphosphate-sugar epimerase
MPVFVTGGGRGFIAGHLVRALERAGHEVRREWVDVPDRVALERAVRGCDAVVPVAALYSFTASALEIEAVDVGGTRNVIAACRAAGVRRLVHTSTAGTCGPVRERAATEEDSPPHRELGVPDKRTKLEAEKLVLAAAFDGLEARLSTRRRRSATATMRRHRAGGWCARSAAAAIERRCARAG